MIDNGWVNGGVNKEKNKGSRGNHAIHHPRNCVFVVKNWMPLLVYFSFNIGFIFIFIFIFFSIILDNYLGSFSVSQSVFIEHKLGYFLSQYSRILKL